MRNAFILLLFLFSGALLNAQEPEAKRKTGRGNLNGLVAYRAGRYSKPPIKEAEVFLIKRGDTIAVTKTGDDGRFYFDSLKSGKYTLRIRHLLFNPKLKSRIKVKALGRTSTIKKPILMRWKIAPGFISRYGKFVFSASENGNGRKVPLDSVRITIKTMDDSVQLIKVTSYPGVAYFTLDEGSYKVIISKPGYSIQSASVGYEEDDARKTASTVIGVRRGKVTPLDAVFTKNKKPKEVLLVPVKDD